MSELTDPIAGPHPAGVNLREDDSLRALYYAIKDARSNARAAERAMLNAQGDDDRMRLPPQWADLRRLSREALTRHTKDIEILCWLVEAEARLGGVAALADIFADAHALVVAHWDDLHSIDTDTVEDKVAPFTGLNGAGAEGTLIQPLRFIPLVPGGPYYECGLWAYQLSLREAEGAVRSRLRTEVDAAGVDAMAAYHGHVEDALGAWTALSGALDAVCGAAAPPSSNIRNMLVEMGEAIRSLAGLSGAVLAPPIVAPAPAAAVSADTPAAAGSAPGAPPAPAPVAANVIATREDAFNELMRIAAFFRRTEPHSPISFALETIVRRGRMDFMSLLEELVPDPSARQMFMTMAGVRPPQDGGSG